MPLARFAAPWTPLRGGVEALFEENERLLDLTDLNDLGAVPARAGRRRQEHRE